MDVVLIHGMGRTPLSMMRLRRRLRRAGHHAVLFGYSPTFETLQGATARLVKLIERRVDVRHYALVGHSLGTVIIRTALGHLGNRAPCACFFMAPPMLACRAARFFSRFRPYQLLTGEMGQLLADESFMLRLPMPPVPTRIYAGVGGPRAAWLPFGMEANDGILSVSEATGRFGAAAVKGPSMHTFIMNSKWVYDDMIRFIETLEQSADSQRHPGSRAMEPRIVSEQMADQPTIRLPKSLNAWGSPEFEAVLKQEVEQLDAAQLPLQQGLSASSHVTDRPFQAMIIGVSEAAGLIRVKAGIFYTGVIAGCSCADDPTPVDELNEYCVLQLGIDKKTAETTVTLLAE